MRFFFRTTDKFRCGFASDLRVCFFSLFQPGRRTQTCPAVQLLRGADSQSAASVLMPALLAMDHRPVAVQ